MTKPIVNVNVGGPTKPSCTYKTKVLKGNLPFASQINDDNTKYVIKFDFDLDGGSVTIPEGCLLEFDGGSLSNGTVVGQETILIYSQESDVIFKNVTKQGTFVIASATDALPPQSGKNGKFLMTNGSNSSWEDVPEQVIVDQTYNAASHNPQSGTAVSQGLSAKQDVISDLSTIRSGAQAGATAYQKPDSGVPKSDLASAVQTSLGKADTAIQDVSGKADKATTLAGYGITDGYTATEGAALEAEVDTRLDAQDALLANLNGSEVIVVADHTQVATPDSQKIYREYGTDSYTDYMYQNSAWQAIATYSYPGVDDEPTAGSQNLVKSGGVYNKVYLLNEEINLKIDGEFIVDKGVVWSNGYIDGSSGEIKSSQTSQFSQPVLLKAGEKLSYKTGATYTKAVVQVNDDTPVQIGDTLSGNVIISYGAGSANTLKEYVAPEDIYIVITCQIASNEISFTEYNRNSIKDQIDFIDEKCNARVPTNSLNLIREFEENKAINSSGAIVNNSDAHITNYIPVKGQDVISNAFHNASWSGGNVYDSNKSFIRTLGNSAEYTYTEGDYYVRFSYSKSESKPMANYGSTLATYTPYDPVYGYLSPINDKINANNSFDNKYAGIDDVVTVPLYAASGKYSTGSGRKSFVIPVKGGDKIEIVASSNYTCCAAAVDFPTERNYTESDTRYTPNSTATITIAEGKKYFVIGLHDSVNDVTPSSLKLNGYDILSGIKGNFDSVKEAIDTLEVELGGRILAFDEMKAVNLTCGADSIGTNGVSVIYEAKSGDEVTIKANQTSYNCWMFSDVYPSVGSYREGFGRILTAPNTETVLVAPEGTKYVMFSKVNSTHADTTPVKLLLNGYDLLKSVNESIADISERVAKDVKTANGQLYPIGSVESENAASSVVDNSSDNYVGYKQLNPRGKRDYFNKNIVAINHDDVSWEDLNAIRKIYNKYGFNGNFNYILNISRTPSQKEDIIALVQDGNDIGLHAFLNSSAWMVNKLFDVRSDGTMTFYGDNYQSIGTDGSGHSYVLYAMDDKIAGYDLEGNYIASTDANAKSVLEWAEYLYNELIDNTLGYSTKGTFAEKFAADYTGTYPTKAQITDGDFEGCGHFTTGLFKGCCSCCNYEVWDRILEVSIAYIRYMYGIVNFTACGPHGARYSSNVYTLDGFTYDDPDYKFLQNGQCHVFSSRLNAWTSLFDTFKRFGIKNSGNYNSPETDEIEAREGMFFGQKGIRGDFFDKPSLRANYLTLMGTNASTPYAYTYAEFEAIWGDVSNWLKYAYENAGVQVTKNGVTATICGYVKNAIDRINYCIGTGKIPTLSFDTIWNTPACSVAFELLCQYCCQNDIELVPVEKARRIATSFNREWQNNYYPNSSFTQTLLNMFGGSSTALSAYLPDGMRLLSNTGGTITAGSSNGHRVLSIEGAVTTNVKVYGLPEGSYKFSINAKSISGDAVIKVFKRKVGDKIGDNTTTLVGTIDDITSTSAIKEVAFDIPAPYRVPVDYDDPASIISEGYENNVCIIEVRYIVPASGDLTIYEPMIELI